MSLVETLKSLLGGPTPDRVTYECAACGETHRSTKSPENARCPACMSRDVERVSN